MGEGNPDPAISVADDTALASADQSLLCTPEARQWWAERSLEDILGGLGRGIRRLGGG